MLRRPPRKSAASEKRAHRGLSRSRAAGPSIPESSFSGTLLILHFSGDYETVTSSTGAHWCALVRAVARCVTLLPSLSLGAAR